MAASSGKAEKMKRPREFMVTVSLVGGQSGKKRLGIDADWADGKTLFIKAILWGAIEDWNKEHGLDEAVQPGDRIVAVNGCSGDSQAMVREIRDRSLLQLQVRREPAEGQAAANGNVAAGGSDIPGSVPGVQMAGQYTPGVAPPRVVDVLLDLRRNAAQEAAGQARQPSGGAGAAPGQKRLLVSPADHYEVLGLQSRSADDAEVKKNYRRLVLTWHPDKHPVNREEAETRIRLINNAYETLGNPLKRSGYDQMLAAMDRKKAGARLDTSFIKPRMSIPKEFMLCPLGYPDRFVRVDDEDNLRVQSREDIPGTSFKDFFQAAKFSLWWLPEVNNMCRLRAKASAASGVDGGLNFTFEQAEAAEAEIALSSSQDMRRANFIAVASPFSQGAFRFEGAFWPGRFVSFRPPSNICMASLAEDGTDVVDFVLVDYSAAYKYMTTTEVLAGAVETQGTGFVKLSDLRADLSVRMYFQQMLGCAVWNNKDFETFFEGHYDTWDYDQKRARVRLRPKERADVAPPPRQKPAGEKPAAGGWREMLRQAAQQADVAQAVLAAGEAELETLQLGEAVNALGRLAEPPPAGSGPPALRELASSRRRMLLALPATFRTRSGMAEAEELSFHSLLGAGYAIENASIGPAGEAPGPEAVEAKEELTRRISSLATARIRKAPDEVERSLLAPLLGLSLDWRAVAEPLRSTVSKHVDRAGADPPGTFLEALKAVASHGKETRAISEVLAKWELKGLNVAEGQVAAEVLITMIEGNIMVSEATSRLRTTLLHRLPLPELVRLVAACAERGLGSDVLKPMLQARVAVAGPGLAAVPAPSLLRLALAAAKSPVIVDHALGPIAAAAAVTMSVWPLESIAELLLVVATNSLGSVSSGARKLFAAATEVMKPRMFEVSGPSLLKTVVAAGTCLRDCRALLEVAAEEATLQLQEFLPDQVLMLTQGLLGLGARHKAVNRILDFWADQLNKAPKPGGNSLSADEVADLARLLALVAPGHTPVFEAVATRLSEAAVSELSAAGRAALEAAFPETGGPDFPSRARLLESLAVYRQGAKLAERSRSRERRRSRSRGCASRSPSRGKRRRRAPSEPREPAVSSEPRGRRAPSDEPRTYRAPSEPRAPREATEPRGRRMPSESRAPSEPRAYRAPSEPRAARGPSEVGGRRTPSEPRSYRGPSEPRAAHGLSEVGGRRTPSEPRSYRGPSEPREPGELSEVGGHRTPSEPRSYRGASEPRAPAKRAAPASDDEPMADDSAPARGSSAPRPEAVPPSASAEDERRSPARAEAREEPEEPEEEEDIDAEAARLWRFFNAGPARPKGDD